MDLLYYVIDVNVKCFDKAVDRAIIMSLPSNMW